jgi:hypothetical protein
MRNTNVSNNFFFLKSIIASYFKLNYIEFRKLKLNEANFFADSYMLIWPTFLKILAIEVLFRAEI